MFEALDGGETVGDACRDRGLLPDTEDDDRAVVLAECSRFYKVPASYVPAVGDAVIARASSTVGACSVIWESSSCVVSRSWWKLTQRRSPAG